MGNLNKAFSLLIIIALTATSLAVITPVYAQPTTKPSIPEFTLDFTSHPYDMPPVVDKDTGEILASGYRDDNQTIIITIKNQPFDSGSNNTYYLFYFIRAKNHVDSNWTETYPLSYVGQQSTSYVAQSNSEFTVVYYYGNHPVGSQLDFQVQAILQNTTQIFVNNLIPGFPAVFQQDNYGYQDVWVPVASSDWSSTQTITIPATAQMDVQNDVALDFSWERIAMVLLGITVVVLAALLVLSLKRRVKQRATKEGQSANNNNP